MSPAIPLRWWSATWPREVESDALHGALRQLVASRVAPVILRAEGFRGQVAHWIGAPSGQPTAALTRHVKGLGITEEESDPIKKLSLALSLRFSTRRRTVDVEHPEQATAGLLAALAEVRGIERLVLEWVLATPLAPELVPNRVESIGPEGWGAALLRAPWSSPQHADNELRRSMAAKRSEPGWRVHGRIGVEGATPERASALLAGVVSALRAVESPGLRLIVRSTSSSHFGAWQGWRSTPAALNIGEVALLAAWPVGVTRSLPISRSTVRQFPPHPSMPAYRPAEVQRLVAVSAHPGVERALVLPITEVTRHLHVVGPTGVGKSTMLLGLITADMVAGRSVVVVDPKGDLATDVLARVPSARRDDVVVLDPSAEVVVGLNPLAGSGDPELRADGVLGLFHELFQDGWGPRTRDILHASLLTLARAGGQSLASLPLLLTNHGFRHRMMTGLDDPLGIGGFWSWFESLSEEHRAHVLGPVSNKLRQLLMRPALRAMLGQSEPRFRLGEVFKRPQIVVVNLAKGLLGPEGANLFGALVLHQTWQATLARTAVAHAARAPVVLYLDEFQDYLKLPLNLNDLLAQARGLGLGLVMAHQHLGQLPVQVRDAVLANAGSRVIFRLSPADARVIARGDQELEAGDIAGLGSYEVYADLLTAGAPTGFMSGRTLPAPPASSDPAQMRSHSQERYGISHREVDAALLALLDLPDEDTVIGVRPRRSGGTS